MENIKQKLIRPVVWSEGMFLLPQHFQIQHQYYEQRLAQLHTHSYYYWGLYAIEIDYNLLKQGKFGLVEVIGVFPDGTFFELMSDSLPTPIDIPSDYQNQAIYLGLNLNENSRNKIQEINVSDTIDNAQHAMPIQINQLNCKLLLETDDISNFTTLCIAWCKERSANNTIMLAPQFIPASLNIYANDQYSGFLANIHEKLREHCQSIQAAFGRNYHPQNVSDMLDVMMLQTINRYLVLFDYYQHQKNVHPEKYYLYLIQMITEINIAKSLPNADPLPIYQHNNLQQTFNQVLNYLEKILAPATPKHSKKITLIKESADIWVTTDFNHSMINHHELILGVAINDPEQSLPSQFANRIKIASSEHIHDFITRSIVEIELEMLDKLPRHVPFYPNCYYFSLRCSDEYQQVLAKAKSMAFHVDKKLDGLQLHFWILEKEFEVVNY